MDGQNRLELREIRLGDFEGILIGHAQDAEHATGCTAVIAPEGMCAAVDVRGGGPASRETALLQPLASAERIHAIVLSGGSAFGLEAGCGAAEFLEERGIGFETGFAKVPLVCQSCIYDLGVGSAAVRPDKKMGRAACADAFSGAHCHAEGNVGAGTGATVGKARGAGYMMKSGLGAYAVQFGELQIGALAVVNALGDIFDAGSGRKIAGMLNEDGSGFADCQAELCRMLAGCGDENLFAAQPSSNTTLTVVLTNGSFNKMELQRVASAAHNGYARTIRPVHTSADGDSIYAASTCRAAANLDVAVMLAAEVTAQAVNRAARAAEPAYGLQSCRSMGL